MKSNAAINLARALEAGKNPHIIGLSSQCHMGISLRFDEAAYLEANPDVAAAVADGKMASGAVHWAAHGQSEGRALRSKSNPQQGHIVIAGTGRAGTTLLVQLFTELEFDTGFDRRSLPNVIDPISHAGLEHDLQKTSPLVVKSPWLADVLKDRIEEEKIKVNYAIIPMRDVTAAADSRRRVYEEAGKLGLDPSTYPGTLWLTDDPSAQEQKLEHQFYKTAFALVRTDTPTIFMLFPRFARDPSYAYEKLCPVLTDYGVSETVFADAHRRVVRLERIHFS